MQTGSSDPIIYVSDAEPGIRRRRGGKRFVYVGPDGERIRSAPVLARIRSLAVPPAYTDVWICRNRRGHLQATGRDARGRKQYRYHPRWRARREAVKFERSAAFARALPRLRRRVRADLRRAGLPVEKVLATVVRLLESTLMRIGNDEYARQNGSYGITTLRSRHVDINGHQLRFGFPGKSSRRQEIKLSNRALARIVRRCQELPGQALFQFRDEHGKVKPIRSTEVNRYLRDAMGEEFTAKDFRTWAATVRVAATCVAAIEAGETPRIGAALSEAAQLLGNTPAVCRRAYVHPVVLAAFEQPAQAAALCEAFATRRGRGELRAEERAVLRYLRARPARDDCMAAQRATGA